MNSRLINGIVASILVTPLTALPPQFQCVSPLFSSARMTDSNDFIQMRTDKCLLLVLHIITNLDISSFPFAYCSSLSSSGWRKVSSKQKAKFISSEEGTCHWMSKFHKSPGLPQSCSKDRHFLLIKLQRNCLLK